MTAPDYPIGLTLAELEQRAWIENDQKLLAVLQAARCDPLGHAARHTDTARFYMAKAPQQG